MPLERPAVRQILRYWLALLRQEEALGNRPKARAPVRPGFSVNLADPRPGPTYFKLRPTDDVLAVLLREDLDLPQPVDPERMAFFGQWLRTAYQREAAAKFGRTDPRQQRVYLGFPTIHDRKAGELACLLRFSASLSWRDAENEPFEPPSYADRKARRLPDPPTMVLMRADTLSDRVLPYLIDTQLLSRTLGITDEEIADLFELLREGEASPAEVVATLTTLLLSEGDWSGELTDPEEALPSELFDGLLAAVRRRLPPGHLAAYPVGLVADDGQLNATWHLQRELMDLQQALPGTPPWGTHTPVWRYLAADPEPPAERTPRGLMQARPLTSGQLATARRFLGGRLTSAQGPPGTGKTDLILNLVADTLITKLVPLKKQRAMGPSWLLVTSTNNRAVDNVLDVLGRDTPPEQLPLGLRVGSMDVTANLGIDGLRHAHDWLARQASDGAQTAYDKALSAFEAAYQVIDRALMPYEASAANVERKARLEARRAQLGEADGAIGTTELVQDALSRLRAVQRVLDDMERVVEGAGKRWAARTGKIWARGERHRTRFDEALAPLDLTIELAVPTAELPEDEQVEAWEDAVTAAMDRLDETRDTLLKAKRGHHVRKERDRIDDELAAIAAVETIEGEPPPLVEEHAALFEAARVLRERWAVVHAEPLKTALRKGIDQLNKRSSLRAILEKDAETTTWLRRLFPVIGCTLLSLGNGMPTEADFVDGVIIDEGGQCHPAYALAGLMRARRALIIGDVHQLEPVVRLTAADEHRVRRAAQITLDDATLEPYRVFSERPASAQALADLAVRERPVLRDHFRCQPAIIAVSDALCAYGLTVHTPHRSLADRLPWLSAPLLFAAIPGQQQRHRGSWANPDELTVVMRILEAIARSGLSWSEVAVLTPYVAQLEQLRVRLRQVGVPLEADRNVADTSLALFDQGRLATGTVHRFQGGERTLIILSTVVTTQRSLGFLDGRVNLLNVAVSRARDHLIVVGDEGTLQQGRLTRQLIERAERLGRA